MRLLAIAFALLVGKFATAQTYTWNVASGDWATPASWTPSRTSPSKNDILIFNGSTVATTTVNNVSVDSVRQLQFINNVSVTFATALAVPGIGTIDRAATAVTGTGTSFLTQMIPGDQAFIAPNTQLGEITAISSNTAMTSTSSATATGASFSIFPRISITGLGPSAFFIQAGSTLTIANTGTGPGITLHLGLGALGVVSGTLNVIPTSGQSRSRFVVNDSLALSFTAGSLFATNNVQNSFFTSMGPQNRVRFDSAATCNFLAGGSAFGLSVPLSKIWLHPKSIYKHTSTSQPVFSGRRYGILEINSPTYNNLTGNINDTCFVNQLLITAANNVGFSSSNAGFFVITGDIVVNSGNLIFGTGTGLQNIILRGTTEQQIRGNTSGEITFGENATLTLNSAGLKIIKRPVFTGNLVMNNTNINLNNDTLIVGNSTTRGSISTVTGRTYNGKLTRWFGTQSIATGNAQGMFPVGSLNDFSPCWVTGTPSVAGYITVNYDSASGASAVSSFNDNATNNVSVNKRLNKSWRLGTDLNISGPLDLRLQSDMPAGFVNTVANMRLILANATAPGTTGDGTGTNLTTQVNKTGLSSAQLNNTFYIGGNSTDNPLPVRFIAISAIAKSTTNIISWTTASESNLSHFEVERTNNDLKTFKAIGKVKATNTKSAKQYDFTDLTGGNATYRIKAVNLDGTVEYSTIISVISKTDRQGSIAYPNPVGEYVQVDGINANELHAAKLYNNLGKEISFTVSALGINTGTLIPGIYYLHTTGSIVKFVKQ